ncbi:uncharacterized protein LACBIDRAFT_331416 [Laccaria bicolor S238N-H82]|uniref:Predicted protein n=1 Tax=Laccaria bicolor (strain S238N-H82 / ATCC MYA-4686) TaxID=486041 RepID=B0DPE3_LACBS|nr:uncharacterized protein LACBIDRAFT_331416 [Laccaria bicolor S238N-H82]EDR03602.1 predicted protein [Laccaria bicolor S238N-H82]|eukprot:XP_001885750.1 predicted protein [Laccaria bicolor S238N-H82]
MVGLDGEARSADTDYSLSVEAITLPGPAPPSTSTHTTWSRSTIDLYPLIHVRTKGMIYDEKVIYHANHAIPSTTNEWAQWLGTYPFQNVQLFMNELQKIQEVVVLKDGKHLTEHDMGNVRRSAAVSWVIAGPSNNSALAGKSLSAGSIILIIIQDQDINWDVSIGYHRENGTSFSKNDPTKETASFNALVIHKHTSQIYVPLFLIGTQPAIWNSYL